MQMSLNLNNLKLFGRGAWSSVANHYPDWKTFEMNEPLFLGYIHYMPFCVWVKFL